MAQCMFNIIQGLHRQVINKVRKDEGAVLLYLIKEISRGIQELSSKGYAHANLTLESVHMKIQESEKDVRVEGNIKIGGLAHCLDIREKDKFLLLPQSIYTPPEIINYMMYRLYYLDSSRGESSTAPS